MIENDSNMQGDKKALGWAVTLIVFDIFYSRISFLIFNQEIGISILPQNAVMYSFYVSILKNIVEFSIVLVIAILTKTKIYKVALFSILGFAVFYNAFLFIIGRSLQIN